MDLEVQENNWLDRKYFDLCITMPDAKVESLYFSITNDYVGVYSVQQMGVYQHNGNQQVEITARIVANSQLKVVTKNMYDLLEEEMQPYIRSINCNISGPRYNANIIEVVIKCPLDCYIIAMQEIYSRNFHRHFYDEIKKVLVD